MNSNVIAFDRNRTDNARSLVLAKPRETRALGKVVSISEWKRRARARRTANGVFFSTGVLLTSGSVA